MYSYLMDRNLNKPQVYYHEVKKCFFPASRQNTEYQAFLKWMSEGNQPQEFGGVK